MIVDGPAEIRSSDLSNALLECHRYANPLAALRVTDGFCLRVTQLQFVTYISGFPH